MSEFEKVISDIENRKRELSEIKSLAINNLKEFVTKLLFKSNISSITYSTRDSMWYVNDKPISLDSSEEEVETVLKLKSVIQLFEAELWQINKNALLIIFKPNTIEYK